MSASLIYDLAPIGSSVSWADGTSRPPERHNKKLAAWKTRNSQGRLIRKQGKRGVSSIAFSPDFTIHEGNLGADGIVVVRIHRTFSLGSDLTFKIVERPSPGAVGVFDRAGDNPELVHLATNRHDAEEWLTRHGYPRAFLDEVTADEVASASIEGRTGA